MARDEAHHVCARRIVARRDELAAGEAFQVVGQLERRRVAVGGVGAQRLGDDGQQVGRQAGLELGERHRARERVARGRRRRG